MVEFSGEKVSAPNEFQTFVERADAGQRYQILINREGKQKTLFVTARSQKESVGRTASTISKSNRSERSSSGKIGLKVGNLNSEIAAKLGLDSTQGIVIAAIQTGSPAQRAGLQPGMVIVEANRQVVQSLEQFHVVMDDLDLGDGLLLLIKSRLGYKFVVVEN